MQVQELRQEYIRKNVLKLITFITGFEEKDVNFKQCEQNVLHKIRSFRTSSLNIHEIKRKMDGLLERFKVENFPHHGDRMKHLYTTVINHPICLNHYEHDIQWALIDFLMEMAYNPFGELRKKGLYTLPEEDSEEPSKATGTEQTDVSLEIVPSKKEDCESDLSDWSTSEDEEKSILVKQNTQTSSTIDASFIKEIVIPSKENSQVSKNEFTLNLDDVQNSWWLDNVSTCKNRSNFCNQWMHLSISNYQPQQIYIAPEYGLLYETLWMLHYPVNCKFYGFENGKASVRNNVSLGSTTPEGIHSFLEYFIPYINMNYALRKFITNIYETQNELLYPKTYEYYANALREILQPYIKCLLDEELSVKEQKPGECYTIIQLKRHLKDNLSYLEEIYDLHSFAILDPEENANHICTAYLLSALMVKVRTAHCTKSANIAISLYLSTIKYFFCLIDIWWKEGRLDDWRKEFLVERMANDLEVSMSANEMCGRIYWKCKEKSFFVANNVAVVINNDRVLKLLKDYSLESAGLLNILHRIDKIADLRNVTHVDENLSDQFFKEFLENIYKFSDVGKKTLINSSIAKIQVEEKFTPFDEEIEESYNKLILANCENSALAACFGLRVFEEKLNEQNETKKFILAETLRNYQLFEEASSGILPFEDILYSVLNEILHSRMNVANDFIVKVYKEDFQILSHLQNIRKVLLLEASDLMHWFYTNIFTQIESQKCWPNSFILTSQLDDILSSKFPELSSLFRLEISSNFRFENIKAMDAVDQIHIFYTLKKPLKMVITEESLVKYNKVFHFLLKIKWGLWALENLRFRKDHRQRPPYAEPKMIDLLMRRLEQLRFWLIYAIQCVHFHLTTHVLQAMGRRLDDEISNCKNFRELKTIHESFINTISEHCFQVKENGDIKISVEQLLNLIYVLRFEWESCLNEIQNEGDTVDNGTNYIASSQVEALESTYIKCHEHLANLLTGEVYTNQKAYLSGLSAAFNNSIPY